MGDLDLVQKISETPSLIEQLGKAFLDLEAHNDASEEKVQWKEIQEHFFRLEETLVNKYLELDVKEKVFKEEEYNANMLLAEKEGTVADREQDMLDQIQQLKDAAVVAITETWARQKSASLAPTDIGDGKDDQVSSPLGDTNSQYTGPEESSPHDTGENAEGVPGEVKPHPELMQFCEKMDAKGLLNFIMENHKNKPSTIEELSIALESAVEPGHLVLASLKGFYPLNETTQEGDKTDTAFNGMRRSCLLFLRAMATFLARADPGADHLLNPEIKQQAKAIANEWKPKLADVSIDAANGNSLEAEAFLQLLGTFSIASEFDEEELCKLVLAVAHNRRAPELCRSLGLTNKLPGLVEALISGGKQIEAVHFIHDFELTEKFPSVPLLKTYLKDLRRNSQGKRGAAGVQNDGNAQELTALRTVIQCVREYGLEAEYPLDPLQRRVAQLEKLKPDKRRSRDSGRHQQFKKPRANGGYQAFRTSVGAAGKQAPRVLGDRKPYSGTLEAYPPVVPNTYSYQVPSQSTYVQQGYEQRSYYYPQGDRVSDTTYNAAPSTYGNYPGTGMQSSQHQPYM